MGDCIWCDGKKFTVVGIMCRACHGTGKTHMEPVTFRSRPQTIEAIYIEHAGTYDIFGTKVEVKADTYAFMQDGHLMTVTGDKFRTNWEPSNG